MELVNRHFVTPARGQRRWSDYARLATWGRSVAAAHERAPAQLQQLRKVRRHSRNQRASGIAGAAGIDAVGYRIAPQSVLSVARRASAATWMRKVEFHDTCG